VTGLVLQEGLWAEKILYSTVASTVVDCSLEPFGVFANVMMPREGLPRVTLGYITTVPALCKGTDKQRKIRIPWFLA